jgi:hypothetical protein
VANEKEALGMAHLTISLSPEVSERLAQRAKRLQMRPEDLSREILEAALSEEPTSNQSARDMLSLAGLLSQPSTLVIDDSDDEISLEQVRSALSIQGGPTLSDIVLEQRGSKD